MFLVCICFVHKLTVPGFRLFVYNDDVICSELWTDICEIDVDAVDVVKQSPTFTKVVQCNAMQWRE